MPPKESAPLLKVRGANENNLKNLDFELPHDRLVSITGLSGSGKSSLAFDTIYAEGQRRYIETFSPYTRQFFDKVKKPSVDLIENVRPAIAIQQRTRISSSRSTVGSLTDINDYLKIVWSNLAIPLCPNCKTALQSWSSEALSKVLQEMSEKGCLEQFLICSPYRRLASAKAQDELERLTTLGFVRFFDTASRQVLRIEDEPVLALKDPEKIILVLDRISAKSFSARRAKDAIEQAYSISQGQVTIINLQQSAAGSAQDLYLDHADALNSLFSSQSACLHFNQHFQCSKTQIKIERPRPGLFSYNNPLGACAECKGFGKVLRVDRSLCVPNHNLSIEQKALLCWAGPGARGEFKRLIRFCQTQKIPTDKAWRELSSAQQNLIFEHRSREYCGVLAWFKRKERKAYKMHVRVFLARYRSQFECPACQGRRLKLAALAYEIEGRSLPEIWSMPISALAEWMRARLASLSKGAKLKKQLAEVFETILARLDYLVALGLPYLSLDRQARTLSGGETQRVNLATALGSGLVSSHFVLDEPSVGLHMRDTQRLLGAVKDLQKRGNSVLMVEHDLECIHAADYIIELGPQAGQAGGEIIYQGPKSAYGTPQSKELLPAEIKSAVKFSDFLKIKGAAARNLKNFDLHLPLKAFVCLSGVSGSGKSTLAHEVIVKAFLKKDEPDFKCAEFKSVQGFSKLKQVLLIDQTPVSKTPRANIATYTGIWEVIRSLLAASDEARLRALDKRAFSFNVDGGRCPTCKGAGFLREDMQFLSDIYIPCEVCLGQRFQKIVLEVKYKGNSVDDLLKMSVQRCLSSFSDNTLICSACETLCALGLGHLSLGHPLSDLSGGEAQRLKLVPFIQESAQGESLLIFDEPTTGLHWKDVQKLIGLIKLLVGKGHSIVCIEHNPILLLSSDWIIDLGPEGGQAGGHIVLQGAPAEFLHARHADQSHTARHLADFSKPKSKSRKEPLKIQAAPAKKNELKIFGAQEHNLKNIDISIPLNKIVALSGVSGSGKSTIAKDIIYAEGQRRYLDCLSPYARQFIKELKKAEIASIENVLPTVCVYQHTFQPGALSTVGTMSEIYTFLRLLYAKVGRQFCPDHPDQAITPLSAEQITQQIRQFDCAQLRILAPVIKSKKGHHRAVFDRALSSEISEVRVDGHFGRSTHFIEGLERNKVHSIDFVLAKFNPAKLDQELLLECVAQALSLGAGTLTVHDGELEHTFSMERTCPVCKTGFFRPDPEDLSFNSKRGACHKCQGRGELINGHSCPSCAGARLNRTALNLRLNAKGKTGLNIHQAACLCAPQLRDFLRELRLDRRAEELAKPVLRELDTRLETLLQFGLDYLPMDRNCQSFSSGELQRLRLATAMGSPLSGVMYIFDEPSAGLHPLDNKRILSKFDQLKERGNSVLLIEHDSDTLRHAEYIIDVGPGAGSQGGEIVFEGSLSNFLSNAQTSTAEALRGELRFRKDTPAILSNKHKLHIENAYKNNIKDLNLELTLNALVCICGVSGAGKSSLLHGIICDTLNLGKRSENEWHLNGIAKIKSDKQIERVLLVDQAPIGKNSRSTPASYLGIWDEIRKIFASSIEAKSRGYSWSYFSYNTGKGRCAECKGMGQIKLEMSFMAEAAVICETCQGRRYTDEADSIFYADLSISQALNLTFEQARLKFANHRRIHQMLHHACELGLGYLTLGQPSSTLSGGESQRIKLVAEIGNKRRGHTLYILDEPTTGLHRKDVFNLIQGLNRLVAEDNSVILIEHDRDVIEHSDFVIELGPGPAEKGGKVIFKGSPVKLKEAKTPWGDIFRQERRSPAGTRRARRFDVHRPTAYVDVNVDVDG